MKKILQYLWVEKYKCIKDQEFNFTDRVTFHYDKKENRISCIKHNENYYDNFFGENIELTCIVGQNGAGKTTLMRIIAEIVKELFDNGGYSFIAIFYDGKKYYGYSHSSHIQESFDIKYEPNELEFYNNWFLVELESYKSIRCIHYSDIFTDAQVGYLWIGESISTASLLRDLVGDEMTFRQRVTTYFEEEFIRQIKLIGEYGKIIETFHIRYMPYVWVTPVISLDLFDEWVNSVLGNDEESPKKEKQISDIKTYYLSGSLGICGKRGFYNRLAISIFFSIVHSLSENVIKCSKKQFKSIISIMNPSSIDRCWDWVINILNNEFWSAEENTFLLPYRDGLRDFMRFIDEKVKLSPNAFQKKVGLDEFGEFTIPIRNSMNNVECDLQIDIEAFYAEYRKVASSYDFLRFSWGLSSGEMSLLNIFSRLYSKIQKHCLSDGKEIFFLPERGTDYKPVENVFLIMDEMENNLHPDWQRILIKAFLEFVKVSFTGSNVHIIMATHSPIMLSDVPKQNVIYLMQDKISGKTCVDSKENHKETFSSNIFKLYNDAFFMKEGAIGAFAEEKLINLLYLITSDNVDDKKEEIKRQIEFIGDPFLKQKFKAKFMKHLSIQNQIAEHEKIIAELKKKAAETDKNDEN